MTQRARRPTDDERTERFDREGLAGPGARIGTPPQRTDPSAPVFESFEQDVTEVTPIPGQQAAEIATLTHPDPEPAPPNARRRVLQHSEPIRVISMKDHTAAARPRSDDPRVQLQVQLRSMAEVAGRKDTPVQLGNLAPPRDPRQARARRARANVAWAFVAILLACAIALAIWLVAGR